MPDDMLTLRYDPLLLPTAQHRAGLAGLLVLCEAMSRRGLGPLPHLQWNPDGTIDVDWTEGSLTAIFNDLYDATFEEVLYQKPLTQGTGDSKTPKPPKRIVEELDQKTGKTKKTYVYDQTLPKLGFLLAFNCPTVWAKLWRDAVWQTLRGIPKTRLPYEERSRGASVSEAQKQWKELTAFCRGRAKGVTRTDDVPSSLFIGAQAVSPDMIPFRGPVDEILLLHFWPVVAGIFVPESVDRDGERDFNGFVFAIPDVADYAAFVEEYPLMISELNTKSRGYRPAGAVISIPQEGGLEYAYHLSRLALAKLNRASMAFNIAGVDLFHLKKKGNTIPVLSSTTIRTDRLLLDRYEAIRGRYNNPLFRRQVILNLLRGQPWHHGFFELFVQFKSKIFIGSGGGDRFCWDVRQKFNVELTKGGVSA